VGHPVNECLSVAPVAEITAVRKVSCISFCMVALLNVQRSAFGTAEAKRWNDDGESRFNTIGGHSFLGAQSKRVFDRIGGVSSLGGLNKKSSSEISKDRELQPLSDQLRLRMHRAFDRIGGMSSFGGLRKKSAD